MNRLCTFCSQAFEVSNDDLRLLKKLAPVLNGQTYDLPPPTLCPGCRQQRRLAFRNERHLYKRKCDFSGKQIISIYRPDAKFPVYESGIWHSDKWDCRDYGVDFDFNTPFFSQFEKLRDRTPRMSLIVSNVEDCPFVNCIWFCKRCYMCVDQGWCEDSYYSYATYHSQSVHDCAFTSNCELAFELTDCEKCYQCHHLIDCIGCSDSYYCVDCQNCSKVAFSKNLRNKKLHIFDRPCTAQEWDDFMKALHAGSRKQSDRYRNDWRELMKKTCRRDTHNIQCENCVGDYLKHSKDCHMCFDCDRSQELRYCTRIDEKVSSAMDIDHGSNAQCAYEGTSIGGYGILFTIASYSPGNNNLMYCDTPINSAYCFGCVSLRNMKYCILNKQYSKEEYERMVPKIIEHMRNDGNPAMNPAPQMGAGRSRSGTPQVAEGSPATGSWGEFFPAVISPFAYNESLAQTYFPLSEAGVLDNGWHWHEESPEPPKVSRSVPARQLPDAIDDIPDDILNWAIECSATGKPFRIIRRELDFCRQMRLPVPELHPDERFNRRMSLRNPRKLWSRECAGCRIGISTSYSPDRPEAVYCEKCYLKKVY